MTGNGSWTGGDPRLRLLRTIAGIVILVLLAIVVLDGSPNDVATLGTLVGALLVILGFEVGINWPRGRDGRWPEGSREDDR